MTPIVSNAFAKSVWLAVLFLGIAPTALGEEEIAVIAQQTGLGPGEWRFSNGPEFPGAAGAIRAAKKGEIELQYNFAGGGNYVAAYCDLNPPVSVKSVSFRVRKPQEATISARVTDSAGQTFQKGVSYDRADWQALTCLMQGWSGHYGGANDGVLRPPLKTIGILVDNYELKSPTGKILIADLNGEPGVPPKGASAAEPRPGQYVVTDFGNDSGFSCGPHATLRDSVWNADFGATDSVWLGHSLSLFGKPQQLALKVRGGARGNRLKIHVGSHFQTFERTVGVLDGAPQTFTFGPPPEGWEHSGAEEKNLSYPLRILSVTLERGDGPAKATSVELSGLWCGTQYPANEPVTLLSRIADGGVEGGARSLTATCAGWNLRDVEIAGTLTMTARDWDDNVLAQESMPFTLPANGLRTEIACKAKAPARLSFADAEFRFAAPGVEDSITRAGLTRTLEDAGDCALRPQSPWGMGVYLYRYGDSPDGIALMDRAAALAQAAGVKWTREEFSWANTEPKRGEYDFHYYDVIVDTARRHGISVYGLLSYWSNWTQPYTPEGIEDFSRWARAVVHHFKDRVKHWEIYNEPNIFFWMGPKELYPVLVKQCYAAIKEEDPEAQVLAVSTSGIDAGFIRKVVEAGARFDVLTVHPYRGQLREEAFIRELRNAAKLAKDRPVWITEMGWSTQIGGTDERAQAQLLARCYLGAIASGVVHNMGWYDFRNDGNDPFYNESNFGVLREDMTPKPAYRALATVCRTLRDGKVHVPKHTPAGVYALQMGDAMAVWSPDRETAITCKVGKGSLRVTNLMGDENTSKSDGKRVVLTLRAACPIFLTGAKVELEGKGGKDRHDAHENVIRF